MENQEQEQAPRSRAAYQRQRRLHSVELYFRNVEDLSSFRAAAEARGYAHNFNAWLLQMLANATSGAVYPPEYVESIKKDAQKLREWLDTTREEATSYRTEVRQLQAQRDALLVMIHALPDGADVAARFLKQSSTQAVVA